MATPTWPQIIDVARDVVALYNKHGKAAGGVPEIS